MIERPNYSLEPNLHSRRRSLKKTFDSMTFEEAYRAIKRSQIEALEQAIPSVLSPAAKNEFGWSLLMLAAIEGNPRIGNLLIERGADISVVNNCGESALSLAAHAGHLPFVKLLKARGASGAVRPHGHTLQDWITRTSGLPKAKIDSILEAV
jgi:ankyrin repeat protein